MITTNFEVEALKAVLDKGELAPEEREKVERYLRAAERSLPLNAAIVTLQMFKVDQPYDVGEIANDIGRISQKIVQEVTKLEDGEALFIDIGHLGHAMRMAIEKNGDEIVFSLYDSSGGMNTHASYNSIYDWFKGTMYQWNNPSGTTGMRLELPYDEFYAGGEKYLSGILTITSRIGDLEQDAINKSIEAQGTNVEAKKKRRIWGRTINVFSRIAPSRVHRLETPQTLQRTSNCTVKRLVTNQIHELGKPLRKKIEPLLLEKQLELLLNAAKEGGYLTKEEMTTITEQKGRLLSDEELKQIATSLALISDLPEGLKDWQNIAALFHHKIAKRNV